MKDIRLVVVSGPSGSGKSTAIKALEDIGFFCVDNLPVTLLPVFLELIAQSPEIAKVATVIDVREREFLKEFPRVYRSIREAGYKSVLIYLEATDEALVRRFSETRRRHPLAETESPIEGILREREILKEVKMHADKVVDTTGFNVHELREAIKDYFAVPVTGEKMTVNIVSFGFRFGVPTDADLVMDIRFLPNPYFVDTLKGYDGRAGAVREFVLGSRETREFLDRFKALIEYLVPLYWREGKSYLTIGIGCTGGRHRSVVVAEVLSGELSFDVANIRVRHRDIDKP